MTRLFLFLMWTIPVVAIAPIAVKAKSPVAWRESFPSQPPVKFVRRYSQNVSFYVSSAIDVVQGKKFHVPIAAANAKRIRPVRISGKHLYLEFLPCCQIFRPCFPACTFSANSGKFPFVASSHGKPFLCKRELDFALGATAESWLGQEFLELHIAGWRAKARADAIIASFPVLHVRSQFFKLPMTCFASNIYIYGFVRKAEFPVRSCGACSRTELRCFPSWHKQDFAFWTFEFVVCDNSCTHDFPFLNKGYLVGP